MSMPLHQCKFVKIDGITYHQKMYVILNINDIGPVFGRIDSIFVQQMEVKLLTRVFSCEYDSHLSAYNVVPTRDICICSVQQLLDYYPLTGYLIGAKRYVVLKNMVFDEKQFNV
jgi:hypothetical protein